MKILLHNHMMLGDTLVMTCAVRDLKLAFPDYEIMVDTNYMPIWDNNPHIAKFGFFDAEYNIGPKIISQSSKTNGQHFTTAYRVCLEDRLGISIPQGPFKPELYLSQIEKEARFTKEPYWIINIDCGPYDSKRWPSDRWQSTIDLCPRILFVQVGQTDDNRYRLKGKNVYDLVGKTHCLRTLFNLYYRCEGSLGLISSQMHLAAAFDKPCITIAGAREPATYEAYQTHRFIHNIGTLPCAEKACCWKCRLTACTNKVGAYPKCMDMIQVEDVKRAIDSYYEGGRLKRPTSLKTIKKKPIFKLLCNAHIYGGAERSCIEIAKMMYEAGYEVHLTARTHLHPKIAEQLLFCKYTNIVTEPCDILMLYASDMVFDFDKKEFDVMNHLQAKRKIMAITYKIGKSAMIGWPDSWDKYIFLSSNMEAEFCNNCEAVIPGGVSAYPTQINYTKVLAPPVDLEPFYKFNPCYDMPLNIMRHSSQGDNKYDENIGEIIKAMDNDLISFYFMPGPSFLKANGKTIIHYPKDYMTIGNFLNKGNLFWYLLPKHYTDQGPRVIMEAMAAGLPCIAENRDGAKNRITDASGWLVREHEECIDIINNLTPQILEQKGEAARERAKNEFTKEKWLKEIIG